MQTTAAPSDADPYWRWHDRMGLPRPGKPAPPPPPVVDLGPRPPKRARQVSTSKDGLVRLPPISRTHTPQEMDPLSKARLGLEKGRKRLAQVEAVRDAEWREYCEGKRASPYGELTIKEWRHLNVAIAHMEHVVIPALEMVERRPSWVLPKMPRPKDHWGHGEFIPNPPKKGSLPTFGRPELPRPKRRIACHWCAEEVPEDAITVEHIIPQWARTLSPALNAAANEKNAKRPACAPCNQIKGPMPPALFARVRSDEREAWKHNTAWQAVARKFAGWKSKKDWSHLIPQIEAEMLKPIERHIG